MNYGINVQIAQAQFNSALNRSGIITTRFEDDTLIPNGAFVVADHTSALPADIYGGVETGILPMKQYETEDSGSVYVLDAAENPELKDARGNVYKVGTYMLGLEFDPEKVMRYRRVCLDDRYEVYSDNVNSHTVVVGDYLKLTNDSFLLTDANAAIGVGFALKVKEILPLNAGLRNAGSKYLCDVVQL